MITATYTRLRSGDWGIRVTGPQAPAPGARVAVTRKDGRTKTETIHAVLWRGADPATGQMVALCAIESGEVDACVECGKPARTHCRGCGAPLHRDCADDNYRMLCQACCY
jgi:hypothetical protein